MTTRRISPGFICFLLAASACSQGEERARGETGQAAGDVAMDVAQRYPNATAPTVFENDRVVVQRVIAEPGEWTGEHSHAGNQLAVVLEGGTLTYREDGTERDVAYEDGQVYWVEASEAHDHAAKGSPVEVVLVTMKTASTGTAAAQEYPSAAADLVFENDHVLVQHLVGEPGQWTGDHAHPGHQLGVVLRGGTIMYREGGAEMHVIYENGQVIFIDATEQHDHVTMGNSAIEVMLITPKG